MFGHTKKKKENKETSREDLSQKKLEILCICGAGLGSSMVVEMTTGDVLDELKVKAKLSHDTISAASSSKADLILTGENFRAQFDKFSINQEETPVIFLKNLTSKEEIKEKILPVLQKKGVI